MEDWDSKWRLMIKREDEKRVCNRILNERLREKKELEEEIECTFFPKTYKSHPTPGVTEPSTSSYSEPDADALLKLLYPIISEEEEILNELDQLEREEKSRIMELSELIISGIIKYPEESLDKFLSFYRDERLSDISELRNSRIKVIGKLHELEREFNLVCSKEGLDPQAFAKIGFEINNIRGIKEELLNSISLNTLKIRCKIKQEFDQILRSLNPNQFSHKNTMVKNTRLVPKNCYYP
ncbi:hypothetical protein TpMuguga_04g00314 [Theileria parva strain Muguga]|uniref:Uncharacterized protein n=1 Tax=Theileria parva TaxID=5875 RepID=Q4N2N4_THEPA|nr:uncharacterized protein TpMuguga_04g00314 [Theileria parva strain Muguga]EAN31666.1 hypothetical protein TpMuguga_04g00314 [Theileria parva strain Muguga]|eukprot:XP_763949.1 hypothetical protein [Theileria parva strain Muguga]